jgi:hypothetical protein
MKWVRRWTDIHPPEINYQSVVKDIITAVGITPGFFLALNVANLIALCGLLLGSSGRCASHRSWDRSSALVLLCHR